MTALFEWVTALLEYLDRKQEAKAHLQKEPLTHRYVPLVALSQTFSANPYLRLSLHGSGGSACHCH